ncbi:iron-sulfur cluster assembly protein [Geodermatophilus ruber]|uniref:Metal-sulfur cluster biosynthetic enzyme n=1 Tax=Geodermatophilus ruber TaxID=504800 RepID=A0A1I4KC72_9ACTN|nr:iron-sulfur cluster assembly protein [Geodermatophilus ruber]SFL76330.1 Metal-sulfur cluster biosynthetic enzyme [Geodermatophilus ruber]
MSLRDDVWRALGTVLDPELDEPITDLDFVASCTVSGEGVAAVRLRLPTFFCAPNFSFLMVADAHDAVSAVEGVTRAEIVLEDHHASQEINGGVAAAAGFAETFTGEAEADLAELRRYFLEKAVIAGQDRVARPLVDAGAGPDELAELTLGAVPASPALDRLRRRRAALGLRDDDAAPLLVHPDGSRVTSAQVPLHLRRARLTRLGIETNGEFCRSFLKTRYADTAG